MNMTTADNLISEIIDRLSRFPCAQRAAFLDASLKMLDKDDRLRLQHAWELHARPDQLPPPGNWNTWLILAGRGFGKTRTGAEWVRAQTETGRARRVALVARSLDEAQSVMIEGESGILNTSPPWHMPTYEPSKRKLTWPNGARALTFSSHEPDQLRGPQFDAAWCDELASWQYPNQTWNNLNFALRLGQPPKCVVTTTPRPIELIRSLPVSPGVHVTRGSTFDNRDNLAPSFFNGIIERYDGTRLGRQEIHAELADEYEDALWKREWIEDARLANHPPVARIVVAIDPAMSAKPSSSETGIVVVGADMHREHAYVIADESGRLTPQGWAMRAVHLFDKFNASRIIAEDNAGGDLVKSTLKAAVPRSLPYKGIKARTGKYLRAEPVAALYEQGRVHHVGRFPELEDQMCTWSAELGPSGSPDRADALVHAITELMIERIPIKIWV